MRRYLYICEDGLVHYRRNSAASRRSAENTPAKDIGEFYAEKPCAKMCTIACVQQVAMMDNRALSARLIPLQKMSVNSLRNLAEDFRNHPSSSFAFNLAFFASISTLFMRPDFINMS